MEAFLARWGVLAVLAGAALEGDASMLMGGVVAHLGLVRLPLVVAAGALGAFLSDGVLFAAGRRGAARMRRTAAWARFAPAVERLAGRVGLWEVVAARFVWGTRTASMAFWGTQPVSYARFAAADALGCALWAVALAGVGFGASSSASALLGAVGRAERWLAVALALALAVAAVRRAAARRAAVG